MPTVIMAISISGTRGEDKWPQAGHPLDCTDEEAEHLIRAGMAVATSGRRTVERERTSGSSAQLTISPPVQESKDEQKQREAAHKPAPEPKPEPEPETVPADAPAVKEPEVNPLEEVAPRRGPGRPPGSKNR